MANKYVLKCPHCGTTDNLHMEDPEDYLVDCLSCNSLMELDQMEIEEE